jgi:integrase
MDSSLRSALQTAVDWGLIEANPCEKVKPPKVRKDKSKIKHLDTAQTKALLGFLDMPYTVTWRGRRKKDGSPSSEHTETRTVPIQLKALFGLAVFGGLRRQEICALRWSDLDLAKGIVDITRAAERVKGGVSDKAPKNESSARPVSLPPSVIALLKAHRKSQFEYRLSIGSKWQGTDFVFARNDGQRIGITTATRELHRIIERYNAATDGDPLPLVGLHGLRHTHSTLLIAAGVDVRTVSGRLGHADTSTTLDIYSHFLKESDAKAAAVLEEILNTKHA